MTATAEINHLATLGRRVVMPADVTYYLYGEPQATLVDPVLRPAHKGLLQMGWSVCFFGESINQTNFNYLADMAIEARPLSPGLGILWKPYHASRVPVGTLPGNPLIDAEKTFITGRMDTIVGWAAAKGVAINGILMECETFEDIAQNPTYSDDVRDLYDYMYDASKARWPSLDIVWYNKPNPHTFGPLFTADAKGDCATTHYYELAYADNVTFRNQGVANETTAVGVWVGVGQGYVRDSGGGKTFTDQYTKCPLSNVVRVGTQLGLPSIRAKLGHPWNKVKHVVSYGGTLNDVQVKSLLGFVSGLTALPLSKVRVDRETRNRGTRSATN